jgi:serine/threonine protein kinase
MKPTSPGGLNEKWIIPILREVALALRYCHEAGIIHRDVKCESHIVFMLLRSCSNIWLGANVLITEQGNVQLCDFGVAGIIENKTDKRSTIIGTPHWMAPELFNSKTSSYGTEVDIWAFGCMAFELATGSPPFATQYTTVDQLAAALQNQTPRLADTNDTRFSDGLKDIVAFCIQDDPKARPAIEAVQQHKYLLNTDSKYPASSLRSLVGSFKVWEARGGSRKSLFFQHGAQLAEPSLGTGNDEWIFSTTANFDLEVSQEYGLKDVIDAYGPDATAGFEEETSRPNRRQPAKNSRRRPPPEALARLPPAPLEKIFDPNTMSNYQENSRRQYGGGNQPPPTSDLQLRAEADSSINSTIIDIDLHVIDSGVPPFQENTIRPNRGGNDGEDDYPFHDFNRPALSDPADGNPNRQTRDWKFPSMAPPASADPELSRFPISYELPRPTVTPGSGGRPALIHHPTEPLGAFGGGVQASLAVDRQSMRSLIDLDFSMPDIPDSIPEYRPSTANSDAASTTSDHPVSANPFELEKHASLYQPSFGGARGPSLYTEDGPYTYENNGSTTLKDFTEMSDFSASDAEGNNHNSTNYDEDGYYAVNTSAANGNGTSHGQASFIDGSTAFGSMAMPPPGLSNAQSVPRDASLNTAYSTFGIPRLPAAPSHESLSIDATQDETAYEISRMMVSMSAQLSSFKGVYEDSQLLQKRGSIRRDPARDPPVDG